MEMEMWTAPRAYLDSCSTRQQPGSSLNEIGRVQCWVQQSVLLRLSVSFWYLWLLRLNCFFLDALPHEAPVVETTR